MQRKPIVDKEKSLDDVIMCAKDQQMQIKSNSKMDIQPALNLGEIIHKEERKGKAKTYYIDNDVSEAISITAQQMGVSESKLVSDILKHVFNVR